ncbi:uncharacterized protein LOC128218245 isoform X3 [Mya arenaria]|uniref:uncharacterized protein LOC128218245 isoform X3 n=1 Tax=Mya arenaria TaxID=6604 RepID=UPI0022E12D3A|nr:uncharacterized protein LOC128218245 isoform X3 [Mya arenaria]
MSCHRHMDCCCSFSSYRVISILKYEPLFQRIRGAVTLTRSVKSSTGHVKVGVAEQFITRTAAYTGYRMTQFGLIVLGGVLGFFIFVCIIAVLIHCWFVHRRRHQYNVIVTDMGNNQPAGRVEDDVQPYYQDDVQPYDPYPAGEVDVNVDIQPYNPAGQVEPDIQPYQPQDLQPYQPEPDVQPYGGDTQPYGGDTRPYQDTQPYGGDTQPYGGDTQPYGGDTQPYGGDTQPYGGNTQPYGGDTQPYGGDTQPYGGDTQPYGGDTQPYDPSRAGIADYPDTDPYPSEPAGYADDDDH